MLVGQTQHGMSEVHRRASLGNIQTPPPCFGLEGSEDVARAPALVLVVVARWVAGLRGNGDTGLGHHPVGHLVEADHRSLRVAALLVEVEHVLHAPHEFRAQWLGDAPLPFQPRFEVPLLSVLLTVSSLISSTTSSSTSLSASIRILHRPLPSGASEQASAIRKAS